jgi:two-component system, NtrC family, sensor kinase
MKVLIAEDDPISLTVLRKTLERWGHDVFAAPDGAETWAAFQHETFPVVISDWMMPGLDGLELVRRIRHHRQNGYVYTIQCPVARTFAFSKSARRGVSRTFLEDIRFT